MQIKKGQVYTRHGKAIYVKDTSIPYIKFGYVYHDLPDFTLHWIKVRDDLPYCGTLKPRLVRKLLCSWFPISPITPPVA